MSEIEIENTPTKELSLRLKAGSTFGFVLGITFGGLISCSTYTKSGLKGIDLARKIMRTTLSTGVISAFVLYVSIFIRFRHLNT